ncbi:hypothetical protein D3C78_1957120 [compost metagenome]
MGELVSSIIGLLVKICCGSMPCQNKFASAIDELNLDYQVFPARTIVPEQVVLIIRSVAHH